MRRRKRRDSGEELLGSKEERKVHRKFLREEKRRVEAEWREEKKRRIMEEKKTKMGWSRPKPEWPTPRAGDEELHRPEGQMRADGFGKRPKEEVGEEMADEEGEKKRERTETATQWESVGGENEEEENKRRRISQVEIMRLECLIGEWVEEVECQMVEEE